MPAVTTIGPALALVLVALAGIAIFAEVVLVTGGIAGAVAAVAGIGAVIGVVEGDVSWPMLVVVGVVGAAWLTPLILRPRNPLIDLGGGAAFFLTTLVYAVVNGDWVSIPVGALLTIAIWAGGRWMKNVSATVRGTQPTIGMESLVGRVGVATKWWSADGTVSVDGSYWSARSTQVVRTGDAIEVSGWSGMILDVVHTGRAPNAPTPQAVDGSSPTVLPTEPDEGWPNRSTE